MGICCFRARVENQSTIGTITPPRPGYSKDKGNHQQNDRLPTSVGVDEDASAIEQGYILPLPKLRIYSLADLKAATRNFKPDSVLGQGGFGTVFKGWVDEKSYAPCKTGVGLSVAVKKLSSESMQGHREWQSEVNFLGRLAHPNLVKLLGYCCEDREFLLVYEFMPKGSLENHLFRRGAEPLSWTIRLKIAIDAARGLAFLHSSEKQVIYRDFKSANILLDSEFNAKLSDFGLAKDGPLLGDSHITTQVVGTYGYAAPEYLATGRLYVKSDVYAFGVVLLEMLTGLQAFDQGRPTGEQNLVNWLQPSLSDRNKLRRILDTKFEGKYPMKGAMQVAQLTLRCIRPKPRERPSMKEVVEALEKIEAIKPAEAPKARSRTHKHISNDQPRSSRVHLRRAMINSHHLQKKKPFNY